MALPFVNDELQEYNNLPAIPSTQPLGNILNQIYALALPSAGTTASRPTAPLDGQMYFDTDRGTPIWWSELKVAWVDSLGNEV